MKRIEIVVRPHALHALYEALVAEGLDRISVSTTSRWQQGTDAKTYRGVAYVERSSPRMRIEVVVLGEQLPQALAAVYRVARARRCEMDITLVTIARTIHIPAGADEPERTDRTAIRRQVA
jgi:nitrogen regulatory protein PII